MPEATPKIFQSGAYKGENGLASASPQSLGWGDPLSWKIPGAGDALPWLDYGNPITVNTVEDDSVTTTAARSAPRIIGLRVDLPLNYLARFTDIDYLHYWMFGFENEPQAVFVFEAGATPWGTTEPALGVNTIFEDGSSTQFTYIRKEPAKDNIGDDVFYYIFASSTAPDTILGPGTLNEISAGPNSFTYTAASVQKYEHLLELDASGRRYRDYLPAEQITGWSVGDKKNLMMTLCKRMSPYDFRYGNSMCRSFTYNQPAQDMARWETNFLAYRQERSAAAGGFGSSTWTLPAALEDNESSPSHYQSRTHLGEVVGVFGDNEADPSVGMTELCSADFSVAVDIPLKQDQSTCSGLNLASPILENKYDITYADTILYHISKVWMGYRDNNTRLFARFASHKGHDMLELLMKNVVLTQAGPDDSDVAMEPLEGKVSATNTADDQWATSGWLFGHSQVQNMPLVMRVRNSNSVNSMFLY
jgi:hypothetical protein